MTPLSITLLGPFQVKLRDKPVTGFETVKERALLAYLAVEADQPQQREMLAEMLWPGRSEAAARANLRHALVCLRRAIGDDEAKPPYLLTTRETVQFNRASDTWVDVTAFTELVSEGIRSDRPNIGCLEDAIELYQGDLLQEFSLKDSAAFEEWALLQREKFHRQILDVLSWLVGFYEKRGENSKALRYAWREVELEPWDERANRQVMRLLATTGQRSAAMAQFETCRRALDKELGIKPEQETVDLYERIREPKGLFASPSLTPHNLPIPLTPFVGREKKLLEITECLLDPSCRLLTLTGVGGSGKTRLAIQAAKENKKTFADGVWFVPLASINSTEHIIPALASALQYSFYEDEEGEGEPREQFLDYLRQKRMLLVMDNFEHLLDGEGERLLVDILTIAPEIKLLATSRARLNVQGENLFHIEGLRTPATEPATLRQTPEDAVSYSALELFVQSAQQAQSNFKLTSENLAHVTTICQLVQGLPLGIELASAWIGVLPPEDIVAEIEGSLDFLKTELRGVPERMRSIRAVFNSSWNMLTEVEQDVFQKLSVFYGGFTRQAAQHITGASLSALVGLVNKSLLRRGMAGRYEIHELLRQYALKQLQTGPGTWREVQDRHSDYYATFLYERGEEMKGSSQIAAFDAVEAEIENVRTGWRWAVDRGHFGIIDKTLDGLYIYYTTRALSQELNALLEKAVAAAETAASGSEDHLLYARLLIFHCWFFSPSYFDAAPRRVELAQRALALVHELGGEQQMGLAYSLLAVQYGWIVEFELGIQLLRDSVPTLRESGEKWPLSISLHYLGRFENIIGEREKAKQLLGESVAISRQIGDRLNLARSLVELGMIATEEQAYDQVIRLCEESREIFDTIGARGSSAFTLRILGYNCLRAGEYKDAIHFHKVAREIYTDIGNRVEAGYMMSFEGLAAQRLGEIEHARERHQKSLALFQEIGEQNGIAWNLREIGDIYRLEGNYEDARQWYKESLQLYLELQGDSFLDHRGKGDIALALGEYAEARQQFQECRAVAQKYYRFENVSYALSGMGRAAVGVGDYEEARQHFYEALQIAKDVGERGKIMIAVRGFAGLLSATGENERAVELAAFVLHHHASWHETKGQAARVMEEAFARLPTEVAKSAQIKGQSLELEKLVTEILMGAINLSG